MTSQNLPAVTLHSTRILPLSSICIKLEKLDELGLEMSLSQLNYEGKCYISPHGYSEGLSDTYGITKPQTLSVPCKQTLGRRCKRDKCESQGKPEAFAWV